MGAQEALFERFRPKTWTEVVGQGAAVKALLAKAAESGWAPRAYWIVGQSGQGKTTIARLIAAEVACRLNTHEVDAGDLTPAEIGKWEAGFHRCALDFDGNGKTGHALIINEAHGLTGAAMRRLDVMLESGMPRSAVVIFTTTVEGERLLDGKQEDVSPLIDRCFTVRLTRQGLCEVFAKRAQEIAEKAGLNGQPLERYVKLAKDCHNSLRGMLAAIERGVMKS